MSEKLNSASLGEQIESRVRNIRSGDNPYGAVESRVLRAKYDFFEDRTEVRRTLVVVHQMIFNPEGGD